MNLREGEKTTEELLAMTDEEIEAAALSDPDAQPTDYDFWKNARWLTPEEREERLRLWKEFERFEREHADEYPSINAILKSYIAKQK